MALRKIEINDTLKETVDQCISELKDAIVNYYVKNPDTSDLCLSNDIDYNGTFHEIIDSNTPIYYSEIDGLYYLYGDEFDQAYHDAGIGQGDEDNHKQVAIYFYLEQQCWEWWNDNHESIQDQVTERYDNDKVIDAEFLATIEELK